MDVPQLGPNVFVLQAGEKLNFVLECATAEEKAYWMDIIRKRAGYRPTDQLGVAPPPGAAPAAAPAK
jgi:hypothetical protein